MAPKFSWYNVTLPYLIAGGGGGSTSIFSIFCQPFPLIKLSPTYWFSHSVPTPQLIVHPPPHLKLIPGKTNKEKYVLFFNYYLIFNYFIIKSFSYDPSRLVQTTSLLFESNAVLCNQQGRQRNADQCQEIDVKKYKKALL